MTYHCSATSISHNSPPTRLVPTAALLFLNLPPMRPVLTTTLPPPPAALLPSPTHTTHPLHYEAWADVYNSGRLLLGMGIDVMYS